MLDKGEPTFNTYMVMLVVIIIALVALRMVL